jgi:hypothetical protein
MADKLDTKTKHGVTVHFHDFGQRTFENYQKTYITASRDAFVQWGNGSSRNGISANAEIYGAAVRLSLQFEIISGFEAKAIDDMKPYVVKWLADEINIHIKKVVTAPADDPN